MPRSSVWSPTGSMCRGARSRSSAAANRAWRPSLSPAMPQHLRRASESAWNPSL